MNFDTWVEKFHPIPNKNDPYSGFDFGEGSVLMTHSEAQKVLADLKLSDDHLWTILEGDDDVYLSHHFHFVNQLGYVITRNAPQQPLFDDILIN